MDAGFPEPQIPVRQQFYVNRAKKVINPHTSQYIVDIFSIYQQYTQCQTQGFSNALPAELHYSLALGFFFFKSYYFNLCILVKFFWREHHTDIDCEIEFDTFLKGD